MSKIHYKFQSSNEHDSITFDGLSIALSDLKDAILVRSKLASSDVFTLQITNAQTNEVYKNDKDMIPKNTSVSVTRVPVARPKNGITGTQVRNITSRYHNLSGFIEDDGGENLAMLNKRADSTVSAAEEANIKNMISQSTSGYAQEHYVRPRFIPQGPPPSTCSLPGHWIQTCPKGYPASAFRPQRQKIGHGIPTSRLLPADESTPGAMLTSVGYAVSKMDAEAYARASEKKGKTAKQEVKEEIVIPQGFLCSLCSEIMTDAVKTSCCATSFCDKCVRDALIESDDSMCPACEEPEVSPDTLLPDMVLRSAISTFLTRTSSFIRHKPASPARPSTASPVHKSAALSPAHKTDTPTPTSQPETSQSPQPTESTTKPLPNESSESTPATNSAEVTTTTEAASNAPLTSESATTSGDGPEKLPVPAVVIPQVNVNENSQDGAAVDSAHSLECATETKTATTSTATITTNASEGNIVTSTAVATAIPVDPVQVAIANAAAATGLTVPSSYSGPSGGWPYNTMYPGMPGPYMQRFPAGMRPGYPGGYGYPPAAPYAVPVVPPKPILTEEEFYKIKSQLLEKKSTTDAMDEFERNLKYKSSKSRHRSRSRTPPRRHQSRSPARHSPKQHSHTPDFPTKYPTSPISVRHKSRSPHYRPHSPYRHDSPAHISSRYYRSDRRHPKDDHYSSSLGRGHRDDRSTHRDDHYREPSRSERYYSGRRSSPNHYRDARSSPHRSYRSPERYDEIRRHEDSYRRGCDLPRDLHRYEREEYHFGDIREDKGYRRDERDYSIEEREDFRRDDYRRDDHHYRPDDIVYDRAEYTLEREVVNNDEFREPSRERIVSVRNDEPEIYRKRSRRSLSAEHDEGRHIIKERAEKRREKSEERTTVRKKERKRSGKKERKQSTEGSEIVEHLVSPNELNEIVMNPKQKSSSKPHSKKKVVQDLTASDEETPSRKVVKKSRKSKPSSSDSKKNSDKSKSERRSSTDRKKKKRKTVDEGGSDSAKMSKRVDDSRTADDTQTDSGSQITADAACTPDQPSTAAPSEVSTTVHLDSSGDERDVVIIEQPAKSKWEMDESSEPDSKQTSRKQSPVKEKNLESMLARKVLEKADMVLREKSTKKKKDEKLYKESRSKDDSDSSDGKGDLRGKIKKLKSRKEALSSDTIDRNGKKSSSKSSKHKSINSSTSSKSKQIASKRELSPKTKTDQRSGHKSSKHRENNLNEHSANRKSSKHVNSSDEEPRIKKSRVTTKSDVRKHSEEFEPDYDDLTSSQKNDSTYSESESEASSDESAKRRKHKKNKHKKSTKRHGKKQKKHSKKRKTS